MSLNMPDILTYTLFAFAILSVLYFIIIGICSDICLCFENKPDIILRFFRKVMGKNREDWDYARKGWKYAPFAGYFLSLHWGYEIFRLNDYVPYYNNIIVLLLSIHSIIFITDWLRERKVSIIGNNKS